LVAPNRDRLIAARAPAQPPSLSGSTLSAAVAPNIPV
jgi:hypothetical protein